MVLREKLKSIKMAKAEEVISYLTRISQVRDALTSLFQSSNENRKMVLRENLKSIKTAKAEGVIPYLTRISR